MERKINKRTVKGFFRILKTVLRQKHVFTENRNLDYWESDLDSNKIVSR